MGTIRKNAKKLQQRLKTDFNVDPEDFKSMLGISASGFMPNMAMLATQTDMTASKQKQVGWCVMPCLAACAHTCRRPDAQRERHCM